MNATMMKIKLYGGALLILALFIAFAITPAYATYGSKDGKAEAEAEATATSKSISGAGAESSSYSEGGAGGDGGAGGAASINIGTKVASTGQGALSSNASNDGVTVEGDRVENNSSNVVLVPNNNTENCLRVWGLGWGNASGSGGIGVPVRSKKCDYEQAADDAFAAGERELGWFWKCENSNLYKSFREDRSESKESAKQDCLDKMLGGITSMKTITSLTEQLAFSEEERRIAREKHSESVERLTSACNESKDRMLAACVTK